MVSSGSVKTASLLCFAALVFDDAREAPVAVVGSAPRPTARAGAFPFAPNILDSALLVTLEPGADTAVVTGVRKDKDFN